MLQLPTFQRKGSHVKTIPPYRPAPPDVLSSDEDRTGQDGKDPNKMKKRAPRPSPGGITKTLGEKMGLLDTAPDNGASTSGISVSERSILGSSSMSSGQTVISARPDTLLKSESGPSSGSTSSMTVTSSSISKLSVSAAAVTASSFLSSISLPSTTVAITTSSTLITLSSQTSSSTTPVFSSSNTMSSLSSNSNTTSSSLTTTSSVMPTTSRSKPLSETSNPPVSSVSSSEVSATLSQRQNATISSSDPDKDKQRKLRRNGPRTPSGNSNFGDTESLISNEDAHSSDLVLNICEEKNLSVTDKDSDKALGKPQDSSDDGIKLNVQYTPNMSSQPSKTTVDSFPSDFTSNESLKRGRYVMCIFLIIFSVQKKYFFVLLYYLILMNKVLNILTI